MVHPIGAVTLDIVFCPLNSLDYISLFHPVCINTHALGHFLNLLKFHTTLLYGEWTIGFPQNVLEFLLASGGKFLRLYLSSQVGKSSSLPKIGLAMPGVARLSRGGTGSGETGGWLTIRSLDRLGPPARKASGPEGANWS